MKRLVVLLAWTVTFSASLVSAESSAPGRIEGRVTRPDATPVGGVSVVINETKQATLTDRRGDYQLGGVAGGTYTLIFTLGKDSYTQTGVQVTAGQTTRLETTVNWEIAIAETVTVYSASRHLERIIDAPSAITVVGQDQIKQEAATGQVPKLLEFTPGAEVTQSGIYDYNLNTRGFNSSLNRRVATLIDGRDPSVPFLGAQEWAGISFPLDDLASVELMRGPSAALYGANASSGVLNMTSKDPRNSEGGLVRFSGGELSTTNLDFRWAGRVGGDWYVKVLAGGRNHGDFSVSRNGMAEYSVPCTMTGQKDCLPQEAVPLAIKDDDQIYFGTLRADKYLPGGGHFTVETGLTTIEGPVFQTGIGRVQLVDVERPWARVNYGADHFNVLAYYTGRQATDQLALASGANLALDSDRVTVEGQTNWELAQGKVRLVAGLSATEEDVDSQGCPVQVSPCPVAERQTLMFSARSEDRQAAFFQVDWQAVPKVKLVAAGRYDESSLHEAQFSPKASLVYSLNENHSLRLTYNEAFQVANYSEFFLQAPVAPAFDLSALEAICLGNGVTDCGLAAPVPVLGLGNEDLELEKIKTLEVGYSGILANKAFLTVDYYNSENKNFITDLLPQVGTLPGGQLTNPNFGAWVGSPAAESTINTIPMLPPLPVAELVRLSAAGPLAANGSLLSNAPDGSSIIAAVSYTNAGHVDTQGADVGLNYYFDDRWNLSWSYSWFDFEIKQASASLGDQLLPNSPKNKTSLGLYYNSPRFDAGISGRWVDDFRWVVGPFQGDVEAYTTVDLNANYDVNDHWSVGLNAANLLDERHWEAFGGDLLGRRVLGHVTFGW